MNRFATRFRRLPRSTTMSGRARLYARAQHAERRRRLLLETLEDRRLLTGEMDITNVVPGSQVTHFEAPLAFTEFRNNSFSVNSEESSIRQVKATLTSLHGQISLPGIGSGHSPNFDHGDGIDDQTFTIRGTVDEINLALEWLVFQPDMDYSGDASITLHTIDLMPLPGIGIQSDTDTVNITVEPANNWSDPPGWVTYPATLDNRFHETGSFTRNDIHINRIITDEQGRLLAAGEKDNQFALARLHPDGSLDTSFGSGGIVTTNLANHGQGNDLLLQPDGKIVVVGTTATNTADSQMLVARYQDNGSLDSSFATNGIFTLDWDTQDSSEQAMAVGLQANGKIVIAGSGMDPSGIIVTQLTVNGEPDIQFDDDGQVGITLNDQAMASDLEIFDDGRILLATTVLQESFVLLELDYHGHITSTLATDMGNQETVNDLLIYPDGRILLAGQANDHLAMARFQSDGALDTSFGTLGKVYTAVGSNNSQIHRVILQPDGRLLAVGQADNGSDQDFSIVRYQQDGTLDNTFDEDGILTIPIDGDDVARDILILDDGSLLLAGGTDGTTSDLVQLMGDTRPGEIQGTLFHDHNGNSTHDSGEPGLAGRTVFLDTNHNNQLDAGEPSTVTSADDAETTADETGFYQFTGLLPGAYTVAQVVPAEWIATSHPVELNNEAFVGQAETTENGWTTNNPAGLNQVIGFSNTGHAGGTTGEARVSWKGHPAEQASYYADTNLLRSITVDDHLQASGKIEIQNPNGSLGDRGYLGFFNSSQDGPDGASQNVTLVGFSFNENQWYLSLWHTTLGYQGGVGRLDSPATTITADTNLDFTFSYDPDGGDHGSGLITGTLGGQQQQIHLTAVQRAALQDISFDAFGLYRPALNDGNYSQPGIDLFVDDLDYAYHETREVQANQTIKDVDLGNQKPNQAPVWSLPTAQVAAEETNLAIQGLSVTDPDAMDDPLQVMISVLHGNLTLAQTTGLTLQTGDGIADTMITMTGSAAMINAALNGLTYQGQQDYFGSEFLALYVNDLGNTGDGEPLADTETLPITVTNVNDAPVAVDDTYEVDENQSLNVVAPGVLVNDYDVENDTLQVVTISEPGHGILTLNANGSLVYIPNFNFNQTDSFTYQLNDGIDVSNVATVKVNVKAQFVWHNSVNPADINGDGVVTPQDALQIINTLNQLGSRELPTDRPLPLQPPFYDVNRDGFVTPADVLMIINLLNEEAQAEDGGGEGEGEGSGVNHPRTTVIHTLETLNHHAPTSTGQDAIEPGHVALQLPLLETTPYHQVAPGLSVRSLQRAVSTSPHEDEFLEQVDWLEPVSEETLDELIPGS
ncbi:MAG: Ig-like domain-containing protein [Planctomycetota bacterium]|nr:Ig-like domain-containing protein [Planctomycetota bacterium]